MTPFFLEFGGGHSISGRLISLYENSMTDFRTIPGRVETRRLKRTFEADKTWDKPPGHVPILSIL